MGGRRYKLAGANKICDFDFNNFRANHCDVSRPYKMKNT
jgi:hypothetical protein